MPERLGTPDVALIPIGAYEPRWFMSAQHVNPAKACDAPRLALATALSAASIPPDRFVAATAGGVYDFEPAPA